MGLVLAPGAVKARQRETRLDGALIASLTEDLRGAAVGSVVASGIAYPASDKARCGSDGYAYRAAVGEALGHGAPDRGKPYPVASMVREVSAIVAAMTTAIEATLPAAPADDAPKADRDKWTKAREEALAAIPDAYKGAPDGAVTWLLATREVG